MTFQEYQDKEMEIKEQMADLQMQAFQKEADIAALNMQITKLGWRLTQLHAEYAASNMEKE